MKHETLNLLQDADLKGKTVLVRVDHNVVKKGKIQDPYRIDSTIGTLFYIIAHGGKFILMTHQGRPKDKKTGNINIDENSSVKPVVDYLNKKLNISLITPEFKKDGDKGYSGIDESIKPLLQQLKNNEIDGIYLPNTRWFKGEEAKGEEADIFAKQLSGIADLYVNDAFGSWQAHASTFHVTKYLPSYAGFLMQKELSNLDRIFQPEKPFLAIVAGAKFDTKIASLNALLKAADHLILGGVIYNAYLCAKYNIEIKGIEQEDIEQAKKFVDFSANYPGKLIELLFIIESDTIEGKLQGQYRKLNIKDIKPGSKLNYVLDASAESFSYNAVKEVFDNAGTIFINAVMGLSPHFNEGTESMYKLIDKNKNAMKLYGGGDTLDVMKNQLPGIYLSALDNPRYYLFTGGGAVLKAIEEGSYTGIEPVKALLKN
jgi:phosphoglycerate kinase